MKLWAALFQRQVSEFFCCSKRNKKQTSAILPSDHKESGHSQTHPTHTPTLQHWEKLYRKESKLTCPESTSWTSPCSLTLLNKFRAQSEHEWRMKLFKTRCLAGMWWVRTSVSEESLRAPSLCCLLRKTIRGGFSCHFKTNEWWASRGLGQHRGSWGVWGGLRARALVPKCPSSSFRVSFHHGVTLRRVMSAELKTKSCKTNFDLQPRVPPLYDSFISKDFRTRISARISPFSLLLLALIAFKHSAGTTFPPIRLDSLRIRFSSFLCWTLPRTSQLRTERPGRDDGTITRSEARLDETHTQHTYGFSPHPSSLQSPPRIQHPHPHSYKHIHTRAALLLRDPLEAQEGGSPPVEPLSAEFTGGVKLSDKCGI